MQDKASNRGELGCKTIGIERHTGLVEELFRPPRLLELDRPEGPVGEAHHLVQEGLLRGHVALS